MKFTDEQLQAFSNGGITPERLQKAEELYRAEGKNDKEIEAKFNERLYSLALPVKNPTPEYVAEQKALDEQAKKKINKARLGAGIAIASPLVTAFTGGLSLPAQIGAIGIESGAYSLGNQLMENKINPTKILRDSAIGAGTGFILNRALKAVSKNASKKKPQLKNIETVPENTSIIDDIAINQYKSKPDIIGEVEYTQPDILPTENVINETPKKLPPLNYKKIVDETTQDIPIQKNEIITQPENTASIEEKIYTGEPYGQKERKTYKTFENSPFGQEEEFMKGVKPQKMYDTISNKDSLEQALNLSNEEAMKLIRSEKPSALRTMANFAKMSEALSNQDNALAIELGNIFQKTGTKEGQAVQARSIISKMSPEGAVLSMIKINRDNTNKVALDLIDNADNIVNDFNKTTDKVSRKKALNKYFADVPKAKRKTLYEKIEQLNNMGALDNANFVEEISKKFKAPNLTAEDIQKAQILAEKIKYSTGRDKEIAIGQLRALISKQVPISTGRKVATIQTMGQLLNLKTPLRNIVSNSLYQGLDTGTQVLAAKVTDPILKKMTGRGSVVMPDIGVQSKGFMKGAKEGLQDVMLGIDTSGNDKFDIGTGRVFNRKPVTGTGITALRQTAGNIPATLEDALSFSLRVPDRAFYEAAKLDITNNFKKLGVEITPEVEAYIDDFARKRTFQDDSALAKSAVRVKRALNANKEFGIGDFILKYPRTPANILSRMFSYSPVGLSKGLIEANQLRTSGQVGELTGVTAQNKVANDLARGLIGTGLFAGGSALSNAGIIQGRRDKNQDVKNLNNALGELPYTFKIGDKNYSYDWLQPIAGSLAMGANTQSPEGAIGSIAEGINTVIEQPMFTGVANTLKGYDSAGENIINMAAEAPLSFVPSILRQAGTFTDGSIKETYSPNDFRRIMYKGMSNIPVLKEVMPNKKNILGEDIRKFDKNASIAEKTITSFISPANVYKENKSLYAKEIKRLYDETGSTKHIPSLATKTITDNGKTITLSAREYSKYNKMLTENNKKFITELMNTEYYKNLNDEEKIKAISNLEADVNTIVKSKLFGTWNNIDKKPSSIDEIWQHKLNKFRGKARKLNRARILKSIEE